MNSSVNHTVELLAPAGNWECARAAVANGANAIYFGLPQFNARLRADNFSEEDLPALMEFLHSHDVSGYVTMNTLVFPEELGMAIDYLQVLEKSGVDGVIVQDLGLASLVKRVAPRLELHASTQMTLTSAEGLEFVQRFLSLDRAVLARELSLSDIENCQGKNTPPLEIFVHGALCVAYSGQCLTSESLGKRSANRGECAQACRMPYRLIVDDEEKDMGEKRYLFSPQDLCALDCIPELVKLGVYSYKIEGRLKSPEYVAAVTAVYRKALNNACGIKKADPITVADRYSLEMVFSRGLTTGWLRGADHSYLTHGRHGKKRGAYVGDILRAGNGWVEMAFADNNIPLRAGDGFVFDAGQDRNKEQGARIWKIEDNYLFFHGKTGNVHWPSVDAGQKLWKTDDPALNTQLQKSWANITTKEKKVMLNIQVTGRMNAPLQITASDYGVSVESEALLVAAEKHALNEDVLRGQLGRLGNTRYILGTLDVDVEAGCMMPLSSLNQLRRALLEKLDICALLSVPLENNKSTSGECILSQAAREALLPVPRLALTSAMITSPAQLHILCRSLEQLETVLTLGETSVCLDFEDIRLYKQAVVLVREYPAVRVYLATPRIQKPQETGFFTLIERAEPDGVLVRNLGALEYFRHKGFALWGDFSLNAANPLTANILFKQAGLEQLTISYDLNHEQVLEMLSYKMEGELALTLYQHIPLFHCEHCVFCAFLSEGKNYKDCGRPCEHHTVYLRDRVGDEHRLMADVGCRNTLFNGRPQSAVRYYSSLRRAGLRHYRIELLDQCPEEIERLLSLYRGFLQGTYSAEQCLSQLNAIERLGVTEGTMEG